MSSRKVYTVVAGDTVEDLAAIFYGQPSLFPKIIQANPFIAGRDNNEIFQGEKLIIPDISAGAVSEGEDDGTDDVVIKIDGVEFPNFTGFTLKTSMDKCADEFTFFTSWDSTDLELREIFRPFKYNVVEVFIGGLLVLTGNIINLQPVTDTNSSTLTVSGYSKSGVLNDCNYPLGSYPLVFNTLRIVDIAQTLAQPFNISVIDGTSDQFVFEEVDLKPTDNVYSFLAKLCKKRGSLLTSLPNGNMIIQKSNPARATISLVEGNPNVLGMSTNYSGQKGYSSVSGLLKGKDTPDPATDDSFTETDPFIVDDSESRPFVFTIDDIETGSLQEAVRAKLRRLWADRISYTVSIQGWRDQNGQRWTDNRRINVEYPSLMIYNNTEFIIRNVELTEDDSKRITKLTLVLPQAYNDEELNGLPWLAT